MRQQKKNPGRWKPKRKDQLWDEIKSEMQEASEKYEAIFLQQKERGK